MLNSLDKMLDYTTTHLESISKRETKNYILKKLQERNPFQFSAKYQKRAKMLKKRLILLKGIRLSIHIQLKKYENRKTRKQWQGVNKRITELQIELNVLQQQERDKAILKLAPLCNFFLPGAGNTMRIMAYTLKLTNATSCYLKQGCLIELKQLAKTLTLISIASITSKFIYNKFWPLR